MSADAMPRAASPHGGSAAAAGVRRASILPIASLRCAGARAWRRSSHRSSPQRAHRSSARRLAPARRPIPYRRSHGAGGVLDRRCPREHGRRGVSIERRVANITAFARAASPVAAGVGRGWGKRGTRALERARRAGGSASAAGAILNRVAYCWIWDSAEAIASRSTSGSPTPSPLRLSKIGETCIGRDERCLESLSQTRAPVDDSARQVVDARRFDPTRPSGYRRDDRAGARRRARQALSRRSATRGPAYAKPRRSRRRSARRVPTRAVRALRSTGSSEAIAMTTSKASITDHPDRASMRGRWHQRSAWCRRSRTAPSFASGNCCRSSLR